MQTPGPRIHDESGPEALKEILSRLFMAKGWGRRQGRLHLERAWTAALAAAALAPESVSCTRVAGIQRGVLEIEVSSGVLLQELVQFHKRRLLEALRSQLP